MGAIGIVFERDFRQAPQLFFFHIYNILDNKNVPNNVLDDACLVHGGNTKIATCAVDRAGTA